jgi:hypothetical protein
MKWRKSTTISSGLFLRQSNNCLHRQRRKGERLDLEETGNKLPAVNCTHVGSITTPMLCVGWGRVCTFYRGWVASLSGTAITTNYPHRFDTRSFATAKQRKGSARESKTWGPVVGVRSPFFRLSFITCTRPCTTTHCRLK